MNEPLEQMLEKIKEYGIDNDRILNAMRQIPRELFVPKSMAGIAYGNHPLHIGYNQTISQPYTVALMLDALDLHKGHTVLEIGTGSGWNAALLQEMVGGIRVISIEYVNELVEIARANLNKIDSFAKVVRGDGSLGYAQQAPYDRIIATCAAPAILETWKEQLEPKGIIVAPVGEGIQRMVRYQFGKETNLGNFTFVPLKGAYGLN